MRVIKPLELSVQLKPFHFSGQQMMAVGVLIAQPFESHKAPYTEQDLWMLAAEHLNDWDVFDEGMPKAVGEYLVYGSYFTSEPMAADKVQVQVGELHKTLKVTGRREWRTLTGGTNPEPVTELPISFDYAYGGETVAENPVGMGADGVLLPQIEHPDQLFSHPKTQIKPGGFSARNILWSPRKDQWGTYNKSWQTTDAPGFARDIDWSIFNLAQPDQWKKSGFWQGGEPFKVVNMHPDKRVQEGKSPKWRVRLFALKENQLFELPCNFETIMLYPTESIQISGYRSQIAIDTFDGSDIGALLVAYENPELPLKTVAHYSAALELRLLPEGDVTDPDDLALRPEGFKYSVLNPPIETDKPVVNLPDPVVMAALALPKIKGGKEAKGDEAEPSAESKVDDAAAPEIGAAAPIEQEPAPETEVDEAQIELDAVMALMEPQLAAASKILKESFEKIGINPDVFGSDDADIESLINAVLPEGTPSVENLQDPDQLEELLKEPTIMAEKAKEIVLPTNTDVLSSLMNGEALSDEQIDALANDPALEILQGLASKADSESKMDPELLDAIKKPPK